MFAKIKNNTILKFPFEFKDLQEENPYTNFGSVDDLKKAYETTEDAQKNGSTLEPVSVAEQPSFDPATQNCILQTVPILKNSSWVLSHSVVQKTQDEIDKYAKDKQDGTVQ